ncbi:MAG TPA: 3-isopropylmalate dehydratase small subunit [Terricaulis sp.]|nr:3-isopropylmalate dehydratase small subunit [Terricaulis sp.]
MSVRTPMPLVSGVAAPLVRANIDTDIIIPSREIRSTTKQGLKDGLFAGWRYTDIDARAANPDFVLNQPRYAEAKIILGGPNFGCGSSREHAVWALHEYGVRAVIAPSFNAIFYGNCIRNSLAPVTLSEEDIATIAAEVESADAPALEIDLVQSEIRTPSGARFGFTMPDEPREMLVNGFDAIDLTLTHDEAINAHRARDAAARPWVYAR